MLFVLAFFISFAHAENVPLSGSLALPVSPIVAQVQRRAHELHLADRDEWRRLVHYKQRWFGSWKSEADGINFFVASSGRTSPSDELDATLAGFFSPEKRALEGRGEPPQTVYCQFPARFEFLDHELGLQELIPAQTCKEWTEFKDRVAARSVTLVFSSFYAGNPSSTYGHSLMRLNKSDGSSGSEHHQLLDYGVNYAANENTSNPLFYTIEGLFGFFKGQFSDVPYYYKVREYGDFESRDLWEYDLDLKPDEVARVVKHLWELGSTYFDYYYLNENCSYHMLTLIEAAAPRTHLVTRVPWWVIPSDSVKAFFDDGLVKKINFRASLNSQFEQRLSRLTPTESTELRRLVANDRSHKRPSTLLPDSSFAADSRARVADAYMDYVDLHYARELFQKNPEYVDPKEKLLIERSHLPMTPALDFSTPPVASPHLSHGSARAMVSRVSNQNYGGATEFSMRFALHDLIDPWKGLPPNADIDFFHLDLRWWDQPSRLRIENAVLFGIGSWAPLTPYVQKSSWIGKIGLQRVDDQRCYNCLAGGVWGGYGVAIDLLPKVMGYARLDAEGFTSPDFSDAKFSLRGGPLLGVRVRFSDEFAWLTEARYFWSALTPTFSDYSVDSRARLTFGSWGLDVHGVWRTENREVGVGLLHYF